MNENKKRKVHLRLWTGLGDYGFGHPNRSGRIWRLDDRDWYVRTQSPRTKKTLRRMASVACSKVTMTPEERKRRALAFAAPLTQKEREAAMRRLFGPWTLVDGRLDDSAKRRGRR